MKKFFSSMVTILIVTGPFVLYTLLIYRQHSHVAKVTESRQKPAFILDNGHLVYKIKVEGGWLYYFHAPGIGTNSTFVPDISPKISQVK